MRENFVSILYGLFRKDTASVLIGNITSRLISFVLFYGLARSLGAENYGILAIVLVGVATVVEMASAGVNASLIRYSARNHGDVIYLRKLMSTSFFNMILLGIFIVGLAVIFSSAISNLFFKVSDYKYLVICGGVAIALTLFFGQFTSYLLGLKRFKEYALVIVLLPLSRLILFSVILFFLEITPYIAIGIFIFSTFITLFISYKYILNEKISIKSYSNKINRDTFSFGKWMFFWAIVVAIQAKADVYFVGYYLTMVDVANYDVATKFIAMIMVVFTSYSAVLKPRMSALNDVDEIRKEVMNTTRPVSIICIFIIICSILLPYLVSVFYSDEFSQSAILLSCMLPSLVFFVFTLPLNNSIFALGKSKYFFWMAFIEMVVKLSLLYFLLPIYGLRAAMYIYMFINLLSLMLSFIFYKVSIKNKIYEDRYICD